MYSVFTPMKGPTKAFTPGTASVKLTQSKPLWQAASPTVVTFAVATDCCTSGMVTRTFEPLMTTVCKADRVTISDTAPEEPPVCAKPVRDDGPVLAPIVPGSGVTGILPTAVLSCTPAVTVGAYNTPSPLTAT